MAMLPNLGDARGALEGDNNPPGDTSKLLDVDEVFDDASNDKEALEGGANLEWFNNLEFDAFCQLQDAWLCIGSPYLKLYWSVFDCI